MNLPKTVCGWTMSEGPRKIVAGGIFDYMDGAGELYIGYRFQHLDVYEYALPGEEHILLELYWMESPDDAFGLLSGDWGGDPVGLGQPPAPRGGAGPWPGNRALYGEGLLRIWSGDLYARIMAVQETAASKAAVMALGQLIVAGRDNPAPPHLLAALPPAGDAGFGLRPDRVCFFRSHLVLNSVYFLSTSNILDLGLSVEAVTAPYSSSGNGQRRSVQLILLRYRDTPSAQAALAHFEKIYLPEKHLPPAQPTPGARQLWQIEDGWLGYVGHGRFAALVFECPSRESAERFLEKAENGFDKLETTDEKDSPAGDEARLCAPHARHGRRRFGPEFGRRGRTR
jgi:hypothetical protein